MITRKKKYLESNSRSGSKSTTKVEVVLMGDILGMGLGWARVSEKVPVHQLI